MFDPVPIHAWLIAEGLAGRAVPSLFEGFAQRLAETPLAIERAHASIQLLHPALRGYSLIWERRTRSLQDESFRRGDTYGESWQHSPLRHMLDSGVFVLRRRLVGPDARLDFPVMQEFRDQGHTDWIGFVHNFDPTTRRNWRNQIGMISSWTTAQADGFGEPELKALGELVATFALACKAETTREVAGNLMAAYVGRDAGRRVLNGEIARGSVERIAAAILFADLRGFTSLTETAPIETVVPLLNDCFDAMGGSVTDQGGEILKFLGDGMLAIFPVAAEAGDACRRALAAAEGADAAITALAARRREAGQPMLDLDLALHLGDLVYGNVGTSERLDFTVIGPAVNEASRIEGLCKVLDRKLLLSASFARSLGAAEPRLRSLGRHPLAGIAEPLEIFGLG